jgi:hemoglobin
MSLYDRIGGAEGIDDVIDRFYDRVVADPFLAPIFAATPMDRLREMQKSFVSAALDGPTIYAGRTLQEAHAGRGITAAHFAAFAGHLFDVLEEVGFDAATVQAVVDRLAVNTEDIIGGYGEEG